MANLIVSYDLNGATPSHKQVDDLFGELGAARARLLETVWWVGWNGSANDLYNAVAPLLSQNDRLLVVEASEGAWDNLLTEDEALIGAWREHR